MLNKKRTPKRARLRMLLAVPLATGMLCISTLAFTKSYGYVDLLPEKASVQKPTEKVSDEVQLAKKGFYSPNYVFDDNSQYKSLEKRLIVINGVAISDNDKYYGNSNAERIVFLKSKNAIDKYGIKGKFGAVEVYGRTLTYKPEYVIADTAKFPAPVLNQDKVKFPSPIVKKDDNKWFTPLYKKDATTGKPVLNEKRYIVINGSAVKDITKFYGVSNAESVRYINNKSASAKYGVNGKNGAVEIKGKNIKYFDKVTIPTLPSVEPPPISQDQKFPPPIIRKDKTSFFPMRSVDKNGNVNSLDARIIVINGKKIDNIETFYGVTNAKNVVDIDAATAIKKYGKGAKYGAVEITGNDLKYVKNLADGPPPPVMEQTKFPPPIVKPDNKNDKKNSVSKSKIAEQANRNQEVISAIANRNDELMQKQIIQNQVRIDQEKVKDKLRKAKEKSDANNRIPEGYPIDSNGNKIRKGKLSKSKSSILIEGEPVDSNGNMLKQ